MHQKMVARAVQTFRALRESGASERQAYHAALEQFVKDSGMSHPSGDRVLSRELAIGQGDDGDDRWSDDLEE